MNIEIIKNKIEANISKKIRVKVNGMRNRTSTYIGTIYETYPFIFTVLVDGEQKSFSYADVITGEVEIHYL